MSIAIEDRGLPRREQTRAPRTPEQNLAHLLRQLVVSLGELARMAEKAELEEEWVIRIRRQQGEARKLARELEETP